MKELRKGEASFFLWPGERLENGIQDIHVLAEDEALLLQAVDTYSKGSASSHCVAAEAVFDLPDRSVL